MKKSTKKKLRIVYHFIGLFCLGFTFATGVNYYHEYKLIQNYTQSYDLVSIKKLGGLPLLAVNKLPSDFNLNQALEELNSETKSKKRSVIWKVVSSNYKGAKKPITFLAAPKDEYRLVNKKGMRGLCHKASRAWANVDYENRKIYFCVAKLRSAWRNKTHAKIAFDNKSPNRELLEIYSVNKFNGRGFTGTIKHEAFHWFLSKHLPHSCSLTCKSPSYRELNSTELKLFRKLIK